jgi:hypothetical protein
MVVERDYFLRHAAALLEAAQLTADPLRAAELTRQAADLIKLIEKMRAPDDPAGLH